MEHVLVANYVVEDEELHSGTLLGSLMLTNKRLSLWITGHPLFKDLAAAGYQRTFKMHVARSLGTLGWYKYTPTPVEAEDRELQIKYLHVRSGREMVINVFCKNDVGLRAHFVVRMDFGSDPARLHDNDQCVVPFILRGDFSRDDPESVPEILEWCDEVDFTQRALPLLATGQNGWVPVEVQLHEKRFDRSYSPPNEYWVESDFNTTTLWKTSSPQGAWVNPPETAMERLQSCLNMLRSDGIRYLTVTLQNADLTFEVTVEHTDLDPSDVGDDEDYIDYVLQVVTSDDEFILEEESFIEAFVDGYCIPIVAYNLNYFKDYTIREIVKGDTGRGSSVLYRCDDV
jgi:hypothetical protein